MRIIIESDDHEPIRSGGQSPTPAATPAHAGEEAVMNGGSPSDALLTELSSTGSSTDFDRVRQGLAGGEPPEWLVEALQHSAQGHTPRGTAADTDGGGAPGDD